MITFERLTREHFPLIQRWLAEPHVARWWHHDPSPDAVEADFGGTVDGLEPAEDHLALVDGEPVGLVQFCRFRDYPDYAAELDEVYPLPADVATIDYFIGEPDRTGRGLGTAMIAAFVERVWASQADVASIVVPVNSSNAASWGALLSAGFRLVARGDLEPDNPIDAPAHEILRIDRPVA